MRPSQYTISCRALFTSVIGGASALVTGQVEASDTSRIAQGQPGRTTSWRAPGNGVIDTFDMTMRTPAQVVAAMFGGITPPQVSAEAFVGAPRAVGEFTNAAAPIGLNSGAIISTGDILNVEGAALTPPPGSTNTVDAVTARNFTPGDTQATTYFRRPGLDAAVLEFDVTVLPFSFVKLAFEFVFTSDEYNEMVGFAIDDGFAIFVNPTGRRQIAFVPRVPRVPPTRRDRWVIIDNINNTYNAGLYTENDCNEIRNDPTPGAFPCAPPNLETEMDGVSNVLKAGTFLRGPLQPPDPITYRMRLIVEDGWDNWNDTSTFIRATLTEYGFADGRDTAATGACCVLDGECAEVTAADCASIGAWYDGDTTICGAVGACCLVDACVEMPQNCCALAGGSWSAGTCGTIEACYLSDAGHESCIETSQACCLAAGGSNPALDTQCEDIGACCASDGSCSVQRASNCTGSSTFTRNGAECVPGICLFDRPAACPSGVCEPLEDTCTCPEDCDSSCGDGCCNLDETPADCQVDCIPAVSEWGLVVVMLGVLAVGTIVIRGRVSGIPRPGSR
ncbi:MAG: choice-of-anchor L domain-containing protein [Phycisphaerae bacterium]